MGETSDFAAHEPKVHRLPSSDNREPSGMQTSLKGSALPAGWSQHYYQAVPHLNTLQELARKAYGPTVLELIEKLDELVKATPFDPSNARYTGQTADDFFRGNASFCQMEAQLVKKLNETNVSDAFSLIKEARYYTPTSRVIRILATLFKRLLQ